ncbi:MAG TPA: response regulator [Nitrososphaera sp.]|nr:response regulator [Nitrososphaera sp.]
MHSPIVEPLPRRLLVVDDEKDIATVLKKGLENYGFKVDVYLDPIQTLIHYKPGSYDLLLLDIKMPGLDGYELFKRIRKIDRKVRVCFLSAAEGSQIKEYKKQIISDRKYFVKKPVAIKDLVDRINSILEEVSDTAT